MHKKYTSDRATIVKDSDDQWFWYLMSEENQIVGKSMFGSSDFRDCVENFERVTGLIMPLLDELPKIVKITGGDAALNAVPDPQPRLVAVDIIEWAPRQPVREMENSGYTG